MGTFLSLAGVANKSINEVVVSLRKYAVEVGGFDASESDTPWEFTTINSNGQHTGILFDMFFTEWDEVSAFVSKDLNTAVLCCHVHDDNLWLYVLFNNGEVASQFNTIPNYWDDTLSAEEINEWKGDAAVLARSFGANTYEVNKYLVHWTDDILGQLAFENDEAAYGNPWQLLDLLNKLKIPYPTDEDGNMTGGETFRFIQPDKPEEPQKPWWKFW